jgi:hypothetical protein
MKHLSILKQFCLVAAFSIFFIACQEDSINEDIDDEAMITATKLADEYLASSDARIASEKSITVFLYRYGKLYYATNTDNLRGYREVSEETVTALLTPGENMFWFGGPGISDLAGIEFDNDSQSKLENEPEEIISNRLWRVKVPENSDEAELKYDILYQIRGNSGAPIRLDPKIKITQSN